MKVLAWYIVPNGNTKNKYMFKQPYLINIIEYVKLMKNTLEASIKGVISPTLVKVPYITSYSFLIDSS